MAMWWAGVSAVVSAAVSGSCGTGSRLRGQVPPAADNRSPVRHQVPLSHRSLPQPCRSRFSLFPRGWTMSDRMALWTGWCPAELRRSDVSSVCLDCDTGRPPGRLISFFVSVLGYGFARRRVSPNARQGLRPQAVILPRRIGGHWEPRP
jgi:hypothetical protein